MINPHLCYACSFLIALLLYMLGWSRLYPVLSVSLLLFVVSSVMVHLVFGITLARKNVIQFVTLSTNSKGAVTITVFIFLLWLVEFGYAGGIPLLKILLRQPYDYKTFGVPSLHVFVVTFSSFYTIFLFHVFLSGRSKHILLLYLVNLSAALLICNRGMLLFNVSASFFVYLASGSRITALQITGGMAAFVVMAYLFGVLGSLRESRAARQAYSNSDIVLLSNPTGAFYHTGLPEEFLWSYIYVTSPLANLQTNIRKTHPEGIQAGVMFTWMTNEVFPDFITKRLNKFLRLEEVQEARIHGPFNASTIYSRSFGYAGWMSVGLMAVIILILPLLFVKMMNTHSPFFITGLAIVCALYLFMAFENTIHFTGFSFQLVYPPLLHAVVNRMPFLRNLFFSKTAYQVNG